MPTSCIRSFEVRILFARGYGMRALPSLLASASVRNHWRGVPGLKVLIAGISNPIVKFVLQES